MTSPPSTWLVESSVGARLSHGLPLTPQMQDMAARSKRAAVRRWLARHPDAQLRQAVYALQLMYHPDHLDTLLGMAERAQNGRDH